MSSMSLQAQDDEALALPPAGQVLSAVHTTPAHPPATVRAKNRRNRYLDSHPDYFSPALELAGPHTS